MELADFLISRREEIAALALEHVGLVAAAMVAAIGVGFPLGVALRRFPGLARPVLGFASVLQTIPSLALFGFLIPLPVLGGVGVRTAVLALVLYALLPIVRNTVTGLRSVDPVLIEVGRGLGMTEAERLRLVEIPLALPVILAGVRIATVATVGLATVAAAIGAGGLGTFIFRGLAMVDHRLILAGAIPAAVLALAADGLLGLFEKAVRR